MQLLHNIYTLILPICTESIIKMKIPLGSCTCKLYAKRNMFLFEYNLQVKLRYKYIYIIP